MNNLKKIGIPVLMITALAVVIKLFSFSTSSEKTSTPNKDTTGKDITESESGEKDRRSYIRDNYKVFSVPLPEAIDFAGESVPIQDIDIKERLDKELVVNTYWHSQTFLFHKRANRWFPLIEKILKENGVPEDLKYLALIESGLDNVVSPAGAAGFWQFMKTTGKQYGLEVNSYVDERYHLEKSTEAACKYLKYAKNKFGSWTLAAASYNMGMGGLENRLKEQAVDSYYDLYLNAETSRYVFRILAAKHILTHSEDFGFNLLESDLYPEYNTKTLEVDTTINDLRSFGKSQGVNYKIIKTLNPWLRSSKMPNSSKKQYKILIPADDFNMKPISAYE